MYISIPIIIIAAIVIGSLWSKYRRAQQALSELYSALVLASQATNFLPRFNSIIKVYEQIDDENPKVDLHRASSALWEFIDEGTFTSRYGLSSPRYNLSFGGEFDSLKKLSFLANSSSATIEERYDLIEEKGYRPEMITARYKHPKHEN
jgi:hypothetical protein